MKYLATIWRRLTPTKALEDSSGKLETAFFESAYRVMYLAGFSDADDGWYKLYSYSVKLMLAVFNLSGLWFLRSGTSLDIIVEQGSVIVIQFISIYRYKNMTDHKHTYKKLATAMESPGFDTATQTRKAQVELYRLTNERYLKLIVGLGSCTLAAWYVYPLVDDLEYNMPVALSLPFDHRTPLLYPFAYILTVILFHYAAFFVMINDVILQAYLVHLLCQFTVLVDCFENILVECKEGFKGLSRNEVILNNEFRLKYITRLGRLINQHKLLLEQYLLNNSHTLELRNTLSAPMLFQVTASGMQICFAGYQVAMTLTISLTKFLMSLLYLGYNLFQLFIFCRWCNEIKIQSENIRDAVYTSGWECGLASAPGIRSRLLIVAMRANRPVVLTAGGLYELSLSSFAALVKTSYSALTVLLRLR